MPALMPSAVHESRKPDHMPLFARLIRALSQHGPTQAVSKNQTGPIFVYSGLRRRLKIQYAP